MNLKYDILWFEDDPEVVQSEVGPEIKEYLESLGFEYNCTHKEEGSEVSIVSDENQFDLILTDLNLEEDSLGKKIIDKIRDNKIYTEVLLYSANADAINKIITDSSTLVERVSFFVGTKNLSEKIKKIIDLTIKKVQDVTNMRGLVIASAIDLEIEIEEIIKNFFRLIGDSPEDSKREEVLKSISENKIERDEIYLNKIKELDHTNIDLLLEEGVLTAANVYDALMSAIKIIKRDHNKHYNELKNEHEKKEAEEKLAKTIELRRQLQNFQKDVISLRNTLAHVKEEINEDGLPSLKNIKANGETIIFNEDKYIEIRKSFNNYSIIIKKLKELII